MKLHDLFETKDPIRVERIRNRNSPFYKDGYRYLRYDDEKAENISLFKNKRDLKGNKNPKHETIKR